MKDICKECVFERVCKYKNLVFESMAAANMVLEDNYAEDVLKITIKCELRKESGE